MAVKLDSPEANTTTGLPLLRTVTVLSGQRTDVVFHGGVVERDLTLALAGAPEVGCELVILTRTPDGRTLPDIVLPVSVTQTGPVLLRDRLPACGFKVEAVLRVRGSQTILETGSLEVDPAEFWTDMSPLELQLQPYDSQDR